MMRLSDRADLAPLSGRLALGLILLFLAPLAAAQNSLGELLDAGAKKLSAEEFRQELVQRMLVGSTATGGSLELIYGANGTVVGTGSAPAATPVGIGVTRLGGEWTIDPDGRICTSMRMAGLGLPNPGVILPPRCQSWFKLGQRYFLSDSDTDRSAKVFPRTVKQ